MTNIFVKNKAFYLFNIFAIVIILVGTFIHYSFHATKEKITQTYNTETLQYVKDFTHNLQEKILKVCDTNISDSLANNAKSRADLENLLSLFITERYKHVYLLGKQDCSPNEYKFLLDGSKDKDDKSEFNEPYEPLELEKFKSVYKTKKTVFFTHKSIESLWITYLSPIVIDDEVQAVLVIDFSMKDYEMIKNSLENFDSFFKTLIVFFIFVSAFIIRFSFIDAKRELQKEKIFTKLELKSKELKAQTKKVTKLNATLEDRVSEELKKNKLQDQLLLQQSRLAQMGEMISMIAHQWRQPLAAISSTSAALELKVLLGKIDDEYIISHSKDISKYSQHLSATIDDFRNFFKPVKKEEESSFDEILDSVMSIVQVSIENKNIKIIKEINSTKKFTTFPNELKQVLLNLIKNAEDMLLEKDITKPYIKITTYSSGDELILEVSDNGGGIPEDIIPKIFDPYFSTKKEKNGTGLGLYMSKTIVDEHCGGVLSVSNDDFGAVFKITLSSNPFVI